MKSVRNIKKLAGCRVLLRIDANVPLVAGNLSAEATFRIDSVLPTLRFLCTKGAQVVVITHLGRPEGKRVRTLSVAPIAKYLAKKMKKKIPLVPDIFSAGTVLKKMKEGEIVMAENIRFCPGEEKNDRTFAKKLAALGDVYVNDAFAVCHRTAASVSAITKYVPSYAGLQLEQEVKMLSVVMAHPKTPLVVVIGGAKLETKVPLIKTFAPKAAAVLTGSMIAEALPSALMKFRSVVRPVDFVEHGDIGPATIKNYRAILAGAKTIIWNGPVGQFEKKKFSKGTAAIARAIATSRAFSVVGGGETVEAIMHYKLQKKYSFISTGGGAMLAFLGGEPMPGLKALI